MAAACVCRMHSEPCWASATGCNAWHALHAMACVAAELCHTSLFLGQCPVWLTSRALHGQHQQPARLSSLDSGGYRPVSASSGTYSSMAGRAVMFSPWFPAVLQLLLACKHCCSNPCAHACHGLASVHCQQQHCPAVTFAKLEPPLH
eukprot:GHRQ01026023.1.p1 GENE.GHRQ01026023.1~~GHRQ01026023.1.p1  ORF type:complete len:147 (+),score=25.40 GHRQ01026023.1:498-938(+)